MQIGSMATASVASYGGASQCQGGGRPPQMSEEMQQEIFQAVDTDGNGSLSESEFSAIRDVMEAHREENGGGGQGMAPPEMSADMQAQIFSELDADGSGEVSADEFSAMKPPPPPGPPPSGGGGEASSTSASSEQTLLEEILEALAEQTSGSDESSDTGNSFREKLEAILQNSVYGQTGSSELSLQSVSGSILNYLS